MERKFGVSVGIGNPFPGLLGLNGAYHLLPDLRLTGGYAEVEVSNLMGTSVKAQIYEVGAQYLFTDLWVRPTAGLHLGYFQVSGDGDITINGFSKSAAYLYSNIGVDWIGASGVAASTGVNVALLNGSG